MSHFIDKNEIIQEPPGMNGVCSVKNPRLVPQMANKNRQDELSRQAIDLLEQVKKLPGGERLVEAMYYQHLNPPEPEVQTEKDTVPALPDDVLLSSALGETAGGWVDHYVDYAEAVSPMTPRIFHESAALWLVSAVIARRMILPMAFGRVYPNLYVVWVANTTLYRKSTALSLATRIAMETMPFLMAAQDTTPEALLSDMAGVQPANFNTMPPELQQSWERARDFCAQKALALDELSGFVSGTGKDYNAGLIESFLRFYDCEESHTRSTKSQGFLTVRNSYMTILGASTPMAMAKHLQSELLWSNGWWPRFAILTPDGKPEWKEPRMVERPNGIANQLLSLHHRLGQSKWPDPPPETTIALGLGVHEAWQKYNRAVSYDLIQDGIDPRLLGTYGRLPTQLLKVAMILASLDWGKDDLSPRIELPHLARAMHIVESWRYSAHRALEMINVSEFDRLRERIIHIITNREPKGASLRDLCQAMKDKSPKQIQDVLDQMVAAGDVQVVQAAPGPKGGRPTDRYILNKE